MRIDLLFSPQQTDELALRDKKVVVIDVLRASTSIITALKNGAREIIPVTTVGLAVKASPSLFGDAILRGGERNGKIIEGFNLCNSPAEYTEERVKGRGIIFSSTNGSFAMDRARYARELAVCGFVNLTMGVHFLRDNPEDALLMCAGKNGLFCIEDAVCAGMLIQRVMESGNIDVDLSDGALAAVVLHKRFGKSIRRMLRTSEHGRYLIDIGFGDDLALCAGVDTIPVLPQLVGNVIRLKTETERAEQTRPQVSQQA